MKLRYWLRALEATVKFPYLWWIMWKLSKGEKVRFVGSFFSAFQIVGMQWEVALFGFPQDRR